MDITKMKMSDGRTLSQTLYSEAQRLKDCIQFRIDDYRENYYVPVIYERTDKFIDSLCVYDIANVYVQGNRLCINLFFDNDKVMRKSGFGVWESETNEEVNIAYLLNYGYEVKKEVWFKDLHDFGKRDGYHFVEDGIEDFLRTSKFDVQVNKIYPPGYGK